MQTQMNCIITEDEPLSLKGLENFVNEIPFLKLTGSCENAMEALKMIKEQQVDLLFLDIQMPGMNGIDFLRNTKNIPATIITTAFPDYALQGYELNIIDYLVKPIPFDRFVKAAGKAFDYYMLEKQNKKGETGEDFFFVKSNNRLEKICFADILFVEALQNYVAFHTTSGSYVTYLTMKHAEEYLSSSRFLKVNKSTIVSLGAIDNIAGNMIKIGKRSFPITRSYKDPVAARLNGLLLKR